MYRVFYNSQDSRRIPLNSLFDLQRQFEKAHIPQSDREDEIDLFVSPSSSDDGSGFQVESFKDATALERLPKHFQGFVRSAVEADVRPCGHHDCSCSCNIADVLTFGRGELDKGGFWEIPCRV